MQLHFALLVICSVIVFGLIDYGDAYRWCSRRYTCYKSQQWKTTHYRACGWLWRDRCQRHVTYFNKMIKSTCHRTCKEEHHGWSSWSSWSKYGSCSASCRTYGSSSYPQQKYKKRRSCKTTTRRHGGRRPGVRRHGGRQHGVRRHGVSPYGGRRYGVRRHGVSPYGGRRYGVRRHGGRKLGVRRHGVSPYGGRRYGVRRHGVSPYGGRRYGVRRHGGRKHGGRRFGGRRHGVRRHGGRRYGGRRHGVSPYGGRRYGVRRHGGRKHGGRRHRGKRHGGSSCSGSSVQYKYIKCNTHYCRKPNGGWSSWSSWRKYGSCSASCRTYGSSSYPQQKYYKRRSCTKPTPRGGRRCRGSSRQYTYAKCNTHYCKINGGWSSWSSWSKYGSCSASCRKCGSSSYPQQKYYKRRSCSNPTPRFGGSSCSGSSRLYKYAKCNTHYCRSNGVWGSWTSWGKWNSCSDDCRKEGSSPPTQTRSRSRMCNNPSPRCNGKSCSGSSSQSNIQTCNTQYCPVDGGWEPFGLWSDWSDCSKLCDGGSRRRTRKRSCTNPRPQYGGKNCTGADSETAVETCNTFKCPDFCTCDVSGDPHYYTPDGAVIHFMGTCKYTLWNSTIANDPCEFRVETKNEIRHGNNTGAWTRFIDFYIKNTKIRFLRGSITLVNGIPVNLPHKDGSSNIEISRSGSYVTAFSPECNIRVLFDGSHLVSVKAERTYYGGKLAGICGNCNGIYGDDLQTKDGQDVSSSGRRGHSDIGNSYKVFDDPNSSCDDGTPLVEIPDNDREKSEIECQYLVSDASPFKACRESNKLNFTKMYESCEYDVAVSTLDDAHCPTLQSTALACSRHGYPVHWRNSTFCPLACHGGFVYKTSVSCTNSCDKPKADQYCLDPTVDGCTCPDDTYLKDDKCVEIDECGSCNLTVGQFSINLTVGDVFPKGECINSQRCDLTSGTLKLVSIPATKQCSADEWCKLNGLGEYNCAKKPASAGGTGSNSTVSETTTPKYTITTDAEGMSGSTDLPANTPEMTTTTSIVTTHETPTESEDDQFEQSTVGDSHTDSTSASTIVDVTEKETTVSDVTSTTPASEVTTITPLSDVTTTTPASEVTTATPASEVTLTTPASEVTLTTPVSEVTTTTPASEVKPTTPASEVKPTTPASEVKPTTPSTTPASSTAIDFDCGIIKRKYRYYPDPDNCKGFIQCVWAVPSKMTCANGSIWSQKYLTCIRGTC